MTYRVRYLHNGEPCYSGTQPYAAAKRLVESGLAEAVVLDEHGFPQVYPNTGDENATRA